MKAPKSSTVSFVAPLVVCLSVLFANAAVHAGNPMYDSWSKHKAGTNVVLKNVSDMGGNKTETEITYTLIEVTPEKVVVEMKSSMVVMGNKMDVPGMKMDIPAAAPAAPATPADAPKVDSKTSEETVTVDGKDYKTTVSEVKMDQANSVSTSKSWMCNDVPNLLVKSVTTMEKPMAGTMTTELVKVELK